jgi:hypothetical protein
VPPEALNRSDGFRIVAVRGNDEALSSLEQVRPCELDTGVLRARHRMRANESDAGRQKPGRREHHGLLDAAHVGDDRTVREMTSQLTENRLEPPDRCSDDH